MQLNRAWIESHLPHQGRMCLLDEVIDWDAESIHCRSATHRAQDNPLRSQQRLGSACGIEYAAQAMALHGALAREQNGGKSAPQQVGLLASVRDVRLFVSRLDDIESDLSCEARRLLGDGFTALYEFVLRAEARILLSGRATVVLDASKRLTI
jgi:predicted hotdog family 3-hydroxylacyl-ACP dehydratase